MKKSDFGRSTEGYKYTDQIHILYKWYEFKYRRSTNEHTWRRHIRILVSTIRDVILCTMLHLHTQWWRDDLTPVRVLLPQSFTESKFQDKCRVFNHQRSQTISMAYSLVQSPVYNNTILCRSTFERRSANEVRMRITQFSPVDPKPSSKCCHVPSSMATSRPRRTRFDPGNAGWLGQCNRVINGIASFELPRTY